MQKLHTLFDYRLIDPRLEELVINYDRIFSEYQQNKHLLSWTPMHWDMGYSGSNGVAPDIGWSVATLLSDMFTSQDRMAWASKGLSSEVDGNLTMFDNAKCVPTITKVLRDTGLTRRAGLLSVAAGKELPWHQDFDPVPFGKHIVRVLWGLDVPVEENKISFIQVGTDKQKFVNKEFYVFWSLAHHRVMNEMTQDRIMLGFDVLMDESKLNSLVS